MVRFIWVGIALVAGVAASVVGYRLVESRVASDIYRQRLQALNSDYEALRTQYNEAVRRTAVTELLVEGGELSVIVRNAEGVQSTLETPFDPSGEIYVDYVLVSGRLLIRRVFDEHTSPRDAMVIDPGLKVNWDDPRLAVGKAVYRRLDEGRWIVSVTGDGSLGLARADSDEPGMLPPPPDVRDYPQLEREIAAEIDEIGAGDVWGWLVGAEAKPKSDSNGGK